MGALGTSLLLRLCPVEVRAARAIRGPRCPLCRAEATRSICAAPDGETVAALCLGCGLYFSEGPALHGRSYDGDFWGERDRARVGEASDRRSAARAMHLERALGMPLSRLSVLEVGAGRGEYAIELARRGAIVTALEPDRQMAAVLAERGIEAHAAFVERFRPERGGFDVVNFSHVLEHVADPVAVLSRARSWLSDRGVVALEVPNADWLAGGRLQSFFFDESTHRYHFTGESLGRVARAAGLTLFAQEEAYSAHWGARASLRALARPAGGALLLPPDARTLRRAHLRPLLHQVAWRLWRRPRRALRHLAARGAKAVLPGRLVAAVASALDRDAR